MYTESIPIVSAAQAKNSLAAALQYAEIGFSVLPLKGKVPSLNAWSQYQVEPATFDEIHSWHRAGLLENVGIVCGAVSNNLVCWTWMVRQVIRLAPCSRIWLKPSPSRPAGVWGSMLPVRR